jgi:hypothetical protein
MPVYIVVIIILVLLQLGHSTSSDLVHFVSSVSSTHTFMCVGTVLVYTILIDLDLLLQPPRCINGISFHFYFFLLELNPHSYVICCNSAHIHYSNWFRFIVTTRPYASVAIRFIFYADNLNLHLK